MRVLVDLVVVRVVEQVGRNVGQRFHHERVAD
jgi:hypothetical protein